MSYFQSVNTSDSTSFKQRRYGEAERARTKAGKSGKAGKVNASFKAQRSTEI